MLAVDRLSERRSGKGAYRPDQSEQDRAAPPDMPISGVDDQIDIGVHRDGKRARADSHMWIGDTDDI